MAELVSPDGKNSVKVTDDGIELRVGEQLSISIGAKTQRISITALHGGSISTSSDKKSELTANGDVFIASNTSTVELYSQGPGFSYLKLDTREKKTTLGGGDLSLRASAGDVVLTAKDDVKVEGQGGFDVRFEGDVKVRGAKQRLEASDTMVLRSVKTMDLESGKVTVNKDGLEVT